MKDKQSFTIVVSGSRTLDSEDIFEHCYERLLQLRDSLGEITLLSGDCKQGIDRIVHKYDMSKFNVELYPANWAEYGKAAGMIRNREMSKKANLLIAYWDGKSKGTKNMIDECMKSDSIQVVEVFKIKGE